MSPSPAWGLGGRTTGVGTKARDLFLFSKSPPGPRVGLSPRSSSRAQPQLFKPDPRPAVPAVPDARVVFRVFFLYYFPSCSSQLVIFCRKTAEKKRTYFISSSHHRDFHMDVTLGQLPKCPGDSRGDTRGRGSGVSRAGRGGAPLASSTPGASRALCAPWRPATRGSRRRAGHHVTGKSPGGNPRSPPAVKQKGKKRTGSLQSSQRAKCSELGARGGGAVTAAAGRSAAAVAEGGSRRHPHPRPGQRASAEPRRPWGASSARPRTPPAARACPDLDLGLRKRNARPGQVTAASRCRLPRLGGVGGCGCVIGSDSQAGPVYLAWVWHQRSWRGVCWPLVPTVGFEMLGVEVAAPDVGVTALESSPANCSF